jgi:Flp pilus assembly protein TadD
MSTTYLHPECGTGRPLSAVLSGLSGLAGLVLIAAAGCHALPVNVKGPLATPQQPAPPALTTANPTAARDEFHKDPTREQTFNVHLEFARALETQGNFEAAVAEYQKALDVGARKASLAGGTKLGPSQLALAERRIGADFDRLGRFAQAEVHYRKALALAPRDAMVWNNVGYSYYLQNRYADAEKALRTAEKLQPGDPRVQTNLGLTLAAEGKSDEALRAFSQAGGPAVGHANLGFILAAMGKRDEARVHYQAALDLQPELTAAREAIARLDATPEGAPTSLASAARAPAPPPPASASREPRAAKPPKATASAAKPAASRRAGTVAQADPPLPAAPPNTSPQPVPSRDGQIGRTSIPPLPPWLDGQSTTRDTRLNPAASASW